MRDQYALRCLTPYGKLSDMNTYRLSTRIDEEIRRKLERRAEVEAKDESAIVREALAAYLSGDVESAYDMVQRIGGLGVEKGGPSDLSTNKKYFEGFGRNDHTRAPRHGSARRPSRA